MPIKFKAQASGDLEIELYDIIGFWGTTPKDFAAKLKAARGKNVTLRINSPGGSVTDGTAIYNMLKQHNGVVVAYIDGIAASMASVIAMAASKVIMPDNTFLMIHNPSAWGEGESEDLRKIAEVLDKMKENLITAYEAKSGADRKDIAKWMDEESWFTAAECLDLGLCDEIVTSVKAAAFLKASDYFPSRFINTGETIPPVIPNGGQEEPQPKNTMNDAEKALLDAANAKVATLETEKAISAKATATAIETAKTSALQEATTNETKRKADIKALAGKYNKGGDLDACTIEALSNSTTPEAFKDLILEVVAKRGTKEAQKPGAGKAKGKATDESEDGDEQSEEEKFVAKYEACKNDRERQALVRANRALARRVSSSGMLKEQE